MDFANHPLFRELKTFSSNWHTCEWKRARPLGKKFGHTQIWAQEVFDRGANAIADQIVADLKALNVEEIYISFDIDVLDQEYAGATGTPETGGLSPHEPMLIMQTLFENFKISGADMVEIAPQVKSAAIKQIEPETTLMVASSLSTFLIQAMGSK